jgi:hypothetical protein
VGEGPPEVTRPTGLPADEYRIAGARDAAALDLEADQRAREAGVAAAGGSRRRRGSRGSSSTKRSRPASSGVVSGVELLTVERQRRLEAQRVARAEARGHEARVRWPASSSASNSGVASRAEQ